jgi:hypothetical protein
VNLDSWLDTLPKDEYDALCTKDAWDAGALAMLEYLIEEKYIEEHYAKCVREAAKEWLYERR